MIFQTSTLTYEERFPVYCNEILGKCKAIEVKAHFAEYVEKIVQKRGWKAIWSCTDVDIKLKENLNILVEVRVNHVGVAHAHTPSPILIMSPPHHK